MYISKDIAERIKAAAKSSGITVKTMLSEIGLGENTIQNMKKSMPQADSLALIANYLGVSVDSPRLHLLIFAKYLDFRVSSTETCCIASDDFARIEAHFTRFCEAI